MKRLTLLLPALALTTVAMAAKVVIYDPAALPVANRVTAYSESFPEDRLSELPASSLIFQSPFEDSVPLGRRFDGAVPDDSPQNWKVVGNQILALTPAELELVKTAEVALSREQQKSQAQSAFDAEGSQERLIRAVARELLTHYNTELAEKHNLLIAWLQNQNNLSNRNDLPAMRVRKPTVAEFRQSIRDRITQE